MADKLISLAESALLVTLTSTLLLLLLVIAARLSVPA